MGGKGGGVGGVWEVGAHPTAAAELFADVQHLRDRDGAYWTGWQYASRAHYPNERSAWTAAAVILAADALSGATGGAGVFREACAPGAMGGAARAADLPACGCASGSPGSPPCSGPAASPGSAGDRAGAFEHP
jgi:hypothetical protein